jgi:hypothetical protein
LKAFVIKTPEKEEIRHADQKKSHHPAAMDNVYENTNPSKWLDQSGETRSQTKWDTESEAIKITSISSSRLCIASSEQEKVSCPPSGISDIGERNVNILFGKEIADW